MNWLNTRSEMANLKGQMGQLLGKSINIKTINRKPAIGKLFPKLSVIDDALEPRSGNGGSLGGYCSIHASYLKLCQALVKISLRQPSQAFTKSRASRNLDVIRYGYG
jgi:hypothetical protein